MTIIRWQPWSEIDTLQKQMNHLFDSFVSPNLNYKELNFVPAAELNETPEAIDLKLELPGMNPDDLEVQVTADAVSIAGERKSETKTTENGVTRSEFRYGSFHRIIPLPVAVKNDQVDAQYKDGILHLNLPKSDAEKNKVVKVKIG
jgi:HSP20 family protein